LCLALERCSTYRLMTGRFHSLLLALMLLSSPALASIRFGLGADYWIDRSGEFNLTLAALAPLTRVLAAGVRFGALIATEPTTAGVPLDLQLRASIARLYLEASAGPWILFTDRPVRAHAAFGFGLQARSVSFGIEVGWLDPNALLGVRFGLNL